MDKKELNVIEELAETKLPAGIAHAYEKYERGKKNDEYLAKRKPYTIKTPRKFERNKKANRKKWIIPVKKG